MPVERRTVTFLSLVTPPDSCAHSSVRLVPFSGTDTFGSPDTSVVGSKLTSSTVTAASNKKLYVL